MLKVWNRGRGKGDNGGRYRAIRFTSVIPINLLITPRNLPSFSPFYRQENGGSAG